MKIRKYAEQRNVILARDYYTDYEINMLLETKEIFFITDSFKQSYDLEDVPYFDRKYIEFRIFTDDLEEIKVVYNKEYGHYETVAIGKNGLTYHINL